MYLAKLELLYGPHVGFSIEFSCNVIPRKRHIATIVGRSKHRKDKPNLLDLMMDIIDAPNYDLFINLVKTKGEHMLASPKRLSRLIVREIDSLDVNVLEDLGPEPASREEAVKVYLSDPNPISYKEFCEMWESNQLFAVNAANGNVFYGNKGHFQDTFFSNEGPDNAWEFLQNEKKRNGWLLERNPND